MRSDIIKAELDKRGNYSEVARQLGCARSSLYNKVDGNCPWKITELLTLSRICKWTVKQFLEIIEYKEEQ